MQGCRVFNGTRLGLRPFRRAALHADGALATGH